MSASFLNDAHIEHPSDQELIITRVFDAPRALLFKVFTEPRHVMAWWGPHGFENTECQMDFKVGGSFRLSLFGPDGNTYPCQGTYREIVEPERIAYLGVADEGHPCGAGLPPRAVVVVDFEEEGENRTRLTINTRLETAADKEAAARGGYVIGWTESLQRLHGYLGRPIP